MTFTIVKAEDSTANYGLLSSDYRPLRAAYVTHEQGHVFLFTQWEHEDDWFCDFVQMPNGYVHISHGKGDRTVNKQLASPEAVEAIEKAFSEQ